MRLLCVPNEWPLPPNTGGRIDVWRRLRYLHQAGTQLGLLTWYDPPRNGSPSPEQLAEARQLCDSVHLAAIDRSPIELLRRLSLIGRLPSHAASRWVSLKHAEALSWAREFKPDALLLDGLYGVAVVHWLSERLGIPWFYRSHNIEHLYMKQQAASTTNWRKKLAITINCLGLRALEQRTLKTANHVFDISLDDQQYWIAQGFQSVDWLPPAVDVAFSQRASQCDPNSVRWDLLYFGNLNTPNNVTAVRWLVQEVLARIDKPNFSVAIAGSRPDPIVKTLAAGDARITLIPDPQDMARIVGSARIIVNPVQTGSGVNLKSVEMLFTQAHLISTTVGVKGLGPDAAANFSVADSPSAFLNLINQAITLGPLSAEQIADRTQSRQLFDPARSADLLLRHIAH